MTGECKMNLASLMRTHKVTIRELSARMNVTMKGIRKIRKLTRVDYMTYCDFTQAVTGVNVFCRGRYDAMARQSNAA